MDLPDFYRALDLPGRQSFDRILDELSVDGREVIMTQLREELAHIRADIEAIQSRREKLNEQRIRVQEFIEQIEVVDNRSVTMELLLSVLRAKVAHLQDVMGQMNPKDQMERKSKLTQSLEMREAGRGAADRIASLLRTGR